MLLREHLKQIRKMKHLSQSELARKMNYDKSHVSHMEAGTRAISTSALQEFRRALDIQNVPLTDGEKGQFLEELQNWTDLYSTLIFDRDTILTLQKDFAYRGKMVP